MSDCSAIWITAKLENNPHTLLANSDALRLLALHVVFVLFFVFLLNQFTVRECLSAQRGQCFQSLTF